MMARLLDLEPHMLNRPYPISRDEWKEGAPPHGRLELPIHLAARARKTEAVEWLIKRGAKIDIFVAAFMGLDDEIRKLVKADPACLGFDLQWTGTPLRAAMWNNHESTFKLLLDLGADPKKERRGVLLNGAVTRQWLDVAQLLLERGVPVDDAEYSLTPLMHAGSVEMAELLLKYKAHLNPNDKTDAAPLHSAIRVGNKKLTELLIARGADVNAEAVNWYTPLEIAHAMKQAQIAKLLQAKGAKWTFRAALLAGQIDLVETYMKEDPGRATRKVRAPLPSTGIDYDHTPLSWAVLHGNVELFRRLLNYPLDPKDQALAVARTNPKMLELLLTTKTDPDIVGPNLRAAALVACVHGPEDAVRLYIKHGAFRNERGTDRALWGEAFVASVGQVGNLAVIKALYENRPKGDVSETLAKALYQAVAYHDPDHLRDRIDVIKFLLAEKAPVDFLAGVNPDLIGADPSHRAIHKAAEQGSVGVMKLLIDAGESDARRDGQGRTPLDLAIKHDRVALADWLIRNTKSLDDTRLKERGVFPRSPEMLALLLKHGLKPTGRRQDGQTPLHAAIEQRDELMVRALLDAGVEVNVGDRYQRTPLHYAAKGGDPRLVELLLKKKAEVREGDQWAYTALHFSRSPAVSRLLLKHGADPYAKNSDGKTAYDLLVSQRLEPSAAQDALLKILREAMKR